VASSFALSYVFSFASLGFLCLLPRQKEEAQRRKPNPNPNPSLNPNLNPNPNPNQAQRRKREWPHRPVYAVAIVLLLGVALTYSLSVNFLSMFESTMCLKFAGGAGC
tara:strand:+ start:54 stop:374 length:321 start_codon:yes stop_codon:yes gene_type:complete